MTIAETTPPPKAFELIVGDGTREILNGDVPVRWCISPELISEMESNEIIDPHVLISTRKDSGREMSRQLVPVGDLMTYVRFNQAGNCKIHAWLVSGNMGRKSLKQTFTLKYDGDYKTELFWGNEVYDDVGSSIEYTEIAVQIPEGVFGKEPAPWLKAYANIWHNSSRVADECDFRKRLIIAFTVKWLPLMMFIFVVTFMRVTFVATMAAIGYHKSVKWLRAWRMFKYPGQSNYFDEPSFDSNAFFFNVKLRIKYEVRIFKFSFLWMLNPLLLSLYTIIAIAANDDITLSMILYAVCIVALSLSAFALVVNLFFVALQLMALTSLPMPKFLAKIIDWTVEQEQAMGIGVLIAITLILFGMLLLNIASYQVLLFTFGFMVGMIIITFASDYLSRLIVFNSKTEYTEIRELLCPKDIENLKANIKAIPSSQRSIRLWYLETKNKVCKPMQR